MLPESPTSFLKAWNEKNSSDSLSNLTIAQNKENKSSE